MLLPTTALKAAVASPFLNGCERFPHNRKMWAGNWEGGFPLRHLALVRSDLTERPATAEGETGTVGRGLAGFGRVWRSKQHPVSHKINSGRGRNAAGILICVRSRREEEEEQFAASVFPLSDVATTNHYRYYYFQEWYKYEYN